MESLDPRHYLREMAYMLSRFQHADVHVHAIWGLCSGAKHASDLNMCRTMDMVGFIC
jgi:hypothetical protein